VRHHRRSKRRWVARREGGRQPLASKLGKWCRQYPTDQGRHLYGMCKSDTLPAGVDCAHSLRPVWRIVCFGKCRCRSPRVKSLKDTGSSARVRGSITPTSAARPGMIGVATVAPSVASGYAPAKAAFQSLIALTARTTRASSTCKPASVIKSLTAYCLRPVSIYLSIIRRSGFLILLGANLDVIIRGFRRRIVGQIENSDAKRCAREPSPARGVLVLRIIQPGFVDP
jgi:hypothetical protein